MTLDFNPSTLTADERLAEAERILKIMHDAGIEIEIMTEREANFVIQMANTFSCSPAQLNWLRDIKDRYL